MQCYASFLWHKTTGGAHDISGRIISTRFDVLPQMFYLDIVKFVLEMKMSLKEMYLPPEHNINSMYIIGWIQILFKSINIYNLYYYFYIHNQITYSLEECLFRKFGCQRIWKAYDDIYLRKTGSMLHPAKGYKSWY